MAPVVTPAPYDLKNAISPNRLTGLWRMLTGYRLLYLAAISSLAVASLAKTSTYLLLRYYVDNVLGKNAALVALAAVALGFVLLAVVEGGFSFLSGRLASRSAEGITLRLRTFLFDHIQRLSFSYHDKTQTGDLIQRSTSDVDAIRRFYADQAIGIGRIVLLFTINFWAIWRLDSRLALMSVVVVPVIVVMSLFFFKRVSKAYEKYQEQEATLSTVLQENLTGVRVVKAFARQQYEREKFEKENWAKFLRGKRLLTMHALFWPTSDILCGLQMLLGFTVGALMAINGTITVGTYLAYSGLLVWLIFPMRNLGRLIVQTSTGMVSYGRVVEVISQTREPLTEGSHRPADDVRGEIEFRDVSFQYQADAPVLQDLSFCVKPGQSVALLGATGSGKTSLVNLLPRFYEYTSGSLTLDGVELKEYPRDYLRHEIGIVEQEPFLFSRTIRENISYGVGRDVPDEEIEAAARAAAIHDVILSFPDGYNTLVGEKGVTLSGGQRQRVAIARTLLKDPRILILDDSTSAVDTETEAEIRGALEGLMQGRSTFIIAHRIQSLMNADQILVLEKGRIVQHGSHDELLAQEGFYRKIYDLQARIENELEQDLAGIVAPSEPSGNGHQ
ncbi:MAG: ABC transporter ATP-binding protein/permease [Anaerolineae bacterium]|jgi:ATP-binding cassette subfamily B protein|nr:ABC transporter ATP-binding protein/permease [Anaerolineae bacterium]